MPQELCDFQLSKFGHNMLTVQQVLHAQTLADYYGDDIPDPQAVVEEDGKLAIFWECDGVWPVTFRLDPDDWSIR